jgi:hypothetical protein
MHSCSSVGLFVCSLLLIVQKLLHFYDVLLCKMRLISRFCRAVFHINVIGVLKCEMGALYLGVEV